MTPEDYQERQHRHRQDKIPCPVCGCRQSEVLAVRPRIDQQLAADGHWRQRRCLNPACAIRYETQEKVVGFFSYVDNI